MMRTIRQLVRTRLSAMVALSALAGHLLCAGAGTAADAALVAAGVFLLAAACSALNQVQERQTDALMARTAGRPLPAGRITPAAALLLTLLLLLAAFALLHAVGSRVALSLGLLSLLWYNGLYTPLKKVSAAAILPGALCGALPPVIGWAAAGGAVNDHRIVLLAGVFFLWQIPHFWRLAIERREEYRRAGLPTLADTFTAAQAVRVSCVWVLALAAATLLLLAAGTLQQPLPRLLGLVTAAALVGSSLACWRRSSTSFLPARPERFLALLVFSLLLEGILTDSAPVPLASLLSAVAG